MRAGTLAALAVALAWVATAVLIQRQPTDAPGASPERRRDGIAGGEDPLLRGPAAQDTAERTSADRADPRGAQVLVADLASGEGVPGVRFLVAGRPQVSDAAGHLAVAPGDGVPRLERPGEPWSVLSADLAEVMEAGRLWIYRRSEIRGVVVPADARRAFLRERTCVTAHLGGAPDATFVKPTPDPWNPEWERAHGRAGTCEVVGVDERGEFVLPAPVSPWLVLVVRSPGWMPAVVEVSSSVAAGAAWVEVPLQPAPQVAGRVRSRGGDPIAHASVRLRIRRRISPDQMSPRWLLLGEAFATSAHPDGSADVSFERRIETDAQGAFEFSVFQEGSVELVAHAPEHRPLVANLGEVRADLQGLTIEADPLERPSKSARIRHGETLYPHQILTLVDVTDRRDQRSVEVALDQDSRVADTWLESGREYWLVVRRVDPVTGEVSHVDGLVRWDGRDDVDLATLPKDLSSFR